ncbi:hypothetical protein H490_0107935 [Leucobacter sp. UCD-THU]|jgi:hypothetical protein|uniref:hypothetical protein n=1 Tax=Leucobacter sp. UCD-THU TaxID=1292023 RepID=UPI00037B3E28|nr:hypothetical protein [Leucobacter sp. UCD-THU]EYT54806.1 hypothetical protein H490_0107935 [Leucobacter sp. UCD-THU]
MPNPAPIRLDADTWLIMRYDKDHPAAVVHRVTDTANETRFLVMAWAADPSKRRMTGIHVTLEEADRSVKWDTGPVDEISRKNVGPPNGRNYRPMKPKPF